MNFNGYDAWLERPYVERARQDAFAEEAVEVFADHFGIEVEDVDDETAIEWFESRMQDAAEDAAIARAEDARDYGDDY